MKQYGFEAYGWSVEEEALIDGVTADSSVFGQAGHILAELKPILTMEKQ